MKYFRYLCIAMLLFTMMGCSMMNPDTNNPDPKSNMNNQNDKDNNSDQSQINYDLTVDDYLTYLQGNGISMSGITQLTEIGYDGVDGKSFEYDGNVYYLLRTPDSTEMNNLIQDVMKTNKITVNRNGSKAVLNASVNGNYILAYEEGINPVSLYNVWNTYDITRNIWPYNVY